MRKASNGFGRYFDHDKESFDLKELKPGDHIVLESSFGLGATFWHHMIVESVNICLEQINVIHYYHDLEPLFKLPSVCRTSLTFVPDRFYRIIYEENETIIAPSEVLRKAESRIGEKRYCPFTNNCEHFASECKTGVKKCHQFWISVEILGKSALSSITSFLNRAVKWFRMTFRSENSWFRQPGVTEIVEYGANIGTGLSIFTAFIIEVALLGHDCKEAKTKFDEEKLTREEYCEVIVKRVCGAACSIPGFVVGFVLGGMVLPVLGAFLGGVVGDFLGKEAGGKLGELLTPLFIEHLACKEKIE
ncbi:uncharacterized protein LOC114520305 [Dendronephthya gigantea]|uniref:uncharacterized protein LOC114520305 n=1 Tax=Dendronephthya gigantea TaxID=151771 RepID=UPI00106CCC74|nr:uncharacterized protein LOC114520305 [Dendronephthya gigantea]